MYLSGLAKLNAGYARSSEIYHWKDPELESGAVAVAEWWLGQLVTKGHVGYVGCYCISAAFAEELGK
jgi:hypothetical protein